MWEFTVDFPVIMIISCSGYKILHTEVAPGFRKEPTNDFHRALDDA
jgi:hypothetical protein